MSEVAFQDVASVNLFYSNSRSRVVLGPVSYPTKVHFDTTFALQYGKFSRLGGRAATSISFHFISFHFISFHIFMEGGPSVITDLQGALRLHYTYITSKRKIITNMKTNYNV